MGVPFIRDNFLLDSPQAENLYHRFARPQPIIDYHCHLPADAIREDRRFRNLFDVWLSGDHYKWRAMRSAGVDERFVTGDASDVDKFEKWAATVPMTLRNPLFHWTHLELNRYFGITRLLDSRTARGVWDECNAMLDGREFTTRGLLARMNVEVVCTTDDPVDSLDHHRSMAADATMTIKVYPTFRPDRAMALDDVPAYRLYLELLGAASGIEITSFDRLLDALHARHEHFRRHGCRASDHGLDVMYASPAPPAETRRYFASMLAGAVLSPAESAAVKSAILHELALMNHEAGWVQQFHVGALRNNNSRMRRQAGPDTGFDSIGDMLLARPLSAFLDRLDAGGQLARTILYNLTPRDNELFASMIGNFQEGPAVGKMQYGPAWWFLDQADGMTRQIEALSNLGLLRTFVGMVTDSRSFLSFPRHEYFRRVLSNILGNDMAKGRIPDDVELAGEMVQDMCYRNAKRYFGLGA
jgi:glucuronate isomerase